MKIKILEENEERLKLAFEHSIEEMKSNTDKYSEIIFSCLKRDSQISNSSGRLIA
jgi:hypothetical protein